MKKMFIALSVILLLSSVTVKGQSIDKLNGTYAYDKIDSSFLKSYFSYLAQDNYRALEPSKSVNDFEFSLSLSTLLKKYNIYSPISYDKTSLTRIKAATMIRTALSNIAEIPAVKLNSFGKFKDTARLSDDEVLAVVELYERGIIAGTSATSFSPYAEMTQLQAIVIIKRVEGLLESSFKKSSSLSGDVIFTLDSYEQKFLSGSESIKSEPDKDGGIVIICSSRRPTTGGTVRVDKLKFENGKLIVSYKFEPSKDGEVVYSMLTYHINRIKISKEEMQKYGITYSTAIEVKK